MKFSANMWITDRALATCMYVYIYSPQAYGEREVNFPTELIPKYFLGRDMLAELESGNASEAFFQTPAPVLGKSLDPRVRDFHPVLGWGFSELIGRTQVPPVPALDTTDHYFLVFWAMRWQLSGWRSLG